MLVELLKTDLIKENSDSVDNIYVLKESSKPEKIESLDFQSFVGFNQIAAKIIKSGPTFFRFFEFTSEKTNAYMFSVPYTKKSYFIFDYLRTLGITLTELNIEFTNKDSTFKMCVHHKIMKVINLGNEELRKSLTFYLYNLCKIFTAIAKTSEIVASSEASVEGDKKYVTTEKFFKDIYAVFNKMKEKVVIDISTSGIVADNYEMVAYTTKCMNTDSIVKFKANTEFTYNVIKTKAYDARFLFLYNKNFNEAYLIDTMRGAVYTNNILQRYNTLDYNEWIPYLVQNICKKYAEFKNIVVQHLDLSNLLNVNTLINETTEYYIQTDLDDFEELVNDLAINCVENYNVKLYDTMCKGITLKSEVASTDLSEQYADDEYAQQLYKQVQDYYETFDLKDLTNTVRGFSTGEIYSMLFIGDSGTGKSTAAKVIPYKCGMPYIVINCSTNIEETDMFGTMIPNPKKVNADDPEFIWEDGILTKAIRNGYCAVIEELNFARPGVLGKLNSLLDESRQIDLANGEIVKAHKNFRIIVTCNVGYEGTNRLNKALINRFEVCKLFKDISKREAIAIIKSRTGYTDENKINAVYDVYNAVKKYSNEQNLGIIVSIRQLMNVFKQAKYYKTASEAVNNTLLNAAFLEEPEHLDYFSKTILPAFNLEFKL